MAVVAGVVHGVGSSATLFLPGRVLPDACRGSANAALHCLRLPHSTKARNCRPHLRRLVSVPVFDRLLSLRSIVMSVSVCVCVWGGLSVCEHISRTTHPIFTKFLCMLLMAVAWSSSGVFVVFVFSMFLCFTDCSCGCVFFQ